MGNAFEMIAVGENCPGYLPIYDGFQSHTVEPDDRSCRSCTNFRDDKCVIDYYDKVVASLDQA